ncbi:MAG: hypothetical protein ACFHHU_00635 [Porticoccaceae bacterium]
MSSTEKPKRDRRSMLIAVATEMARYGYTDAEVIEYSVSDSTRLGQFTDPETVTDCILGQSSDVELVFPRGYLPDNQRLTVHPAHAPEEMFGIHSAFGALELALNAVRPVAPPDNELAHCYLGILALAHQGQISLHNNGFGFWPMFADGERQPINECLVASCLSHGWLEWDKGPFRGSKAILTAEGRRYFRANANANSTQSAPPPSRDIENDTCKTI